MFRNFGYSITINENRPLSRGTLTLQSADPLAPPLNDPNYGAETREIERLGRGIKLARRVLAQPAFDAKREAEPAPGPPVQSDDEADRKGVGEGKGGGGRVGWGERG